MYDLVNGRTLVVIAAAVLLMIIVLILLRMVAVYRGADRRRHMDASSLGLSLPDELAPMRAALVAIGFSRLGEAQVDVPGGFLDPGRLAPGSSAGPEHLGPLTDRHAVFVFVDAEASVVAEVVHVPFATDLVALTTTFPDGTVVETMFPMGESIHDADFHSGHVTTGLPDAYAEQVRLVVEWRTRHGTPRSVATMADYLRDDANYRVRFAKRKLRRPFIRHQLVPTGISALVILGIAAALTR